VPTKSFRLLGLSAILVVATVALAVWSVSAFRYAHTTHGWHMTYGNVVAQPKDRAAIQFNDTAGRQHLMPLAVGDTDDLPVGSIVKVSYEVSTDGRTRSELSVQPGARASALTVLALLAALGAGLAFWRSGQERRTGKVVTA
jgi:uncharacterized protein HemX